MRCFVSVEGWGVHVVASRHPIKPYRAEELAARMPLDAKRDLLEWSSSQDPSACLGQVLALENPIEQILNPNPEIRITDDRPYNEYFLLRRWKLRRK